MKKLILIGLSLLFALTAFLLPGCAAPAAPHARYNSAPQAPALPALTAAPAYPQEFNTEEYDTVNEVGYHSPLDNPFSTFSIDVDTASYSNVRRMLLNREPVPVDAVRIEEFINYFRYDYARPQGEEPISIYREVAQCPWNKEHDLLLVGLSSQDLREEEMPPSNLVFLLDVSGSMQDENKLPLVKKAFHLLTEQLTSRDRISIVTYAGSDEIVLQGESGDRKARIMRAIDSLSAGGSTAGSAGIVTAYQIAEENFIEGGNNRVILATDGDFNVGVTGDAALTRLIEQKRDRGVFLSVMGFGEGNLKDSKMESLADNGNGNYSYIDSVLEARKVLVEEMGSTLSTVAKDVKIQVEFNPGKVAAYRLIGYENRALNDEDFENDAKDAGEMGARHRVTALFEIVPADSEESIDGLESKYQSKDVVQSDELATVSIRYKDPDADESKLLSEIVDAHHFAPTPSSGFQFASAIAELGLLMRQSEFKGDASYVHVINTAQALADDDYKLEFVELARLAFGQRGQALD